MLGKSLHHLFHEAPRFFKLKMFLEMFAKRAEIFQE